MSSVVRSMDSALKTMDLEKVTIGQMIFIINFISFPTFISFPLQSLERGGIPFSRSVQTGGGNFLNFQEREGKRVGLIF